MSDDVRGMTLVAGVGNIFMGDDAFGVEVVQRLHAHPLPAHVRIEDFGIRSYDLAYALMEPWELVILVDAVPLNEEPGTIALIEPAMPTASDDPGAPVVFDGHTMSPVAVLHLVHSLGGKVGRMLVVGCQPSTVEADEEGAMGLSAPVEAAVDEAIRMIKEIVSRNSETAAA